MNVLLINPPCEHIIRESLPPVVEDSTGVCPPLGLLYVAAYAEQVKGCRVQVLDCQAEGIGHDRLAKAISERQPDVVGVQVMTFTLIDATMLADTVRSVAPESLIVFGGPHPTIYPVQTTRIPAVDATVVGEGEFPFSELLAHVRDGKSIDSLGSVLTKQALDSGAEPPHLSYIEDLDSLRPPARRLIDPSLYSSAMATHRRVTTMMSSRGCPFQCTFCDRPQMGKRFRKRSAQSVVDEMAFCVREQHVGEIIFYDDTFTVDRKRVFEICDLIHERQLNVAWDIRARVDTMSPEMIEALYAAGCRRIHYGVETGCQRLQAEIRKNLDLARVREVFGLTQRTGIETLGYFMLGLPTETESDIQETLSLIVTLPMDYAHISLFTPYPGTAVYRAALQSGTYERDYWREFAAHPTPGFTPRYCTENFSEQRLQSLLKQAYASFYRRPTYLWQRLKKIRSPGELIKKGTLGIKLLMEVSHRD